MPGNAEFDLLVTTTLRKRMGKVADNATVSTALLDRMRRKGKNKKLDGGRTIVQELEIGLNPNGGFFSGTDMLNTTIFDHLSAAEYQWRNAYMPCVWTGEERRKNSGDSQVIDSVASRIANTEKSLIDLIAQASYSNGTSFGGKQMHGLGLMVVASPTSGIVGGIDRAGTGNSFWQNKATTVAMATAANMSGSSGTNPTLMVMAMNSITISATRGKDRPDLYVTDSIGYQRYLESLQAIQQITSTDMAGSGFTSLKYFGGGANADVVMDNGYCPTKTMYALNTDFLYWRPHTDLNFEPLGGERIPVNQDAVIKYLGVMGNFTSSNLARQGIITSSN